MKLSQQPQMKSIPTNFTRSILEDKYLSYLRGIK